MLAHKSDKLLKEDKLDIHLGLEMSIWYWHLEDGA